MARRRDACRAWWRALGGDRARPAPWSCVRAPRREAPACRRAREPAHHGTRGRLASALIDAPGVRSGARMKRARLLLLASLFACAPATAPVSRIAVTQSAPEVDVVRVLDDWHDA